MKAEGVGLTETTEESTKSPDTTTSQDGGQLIDEIESSSGGESGAKSEWQIQIERNLKEVNNALKRIERDKVSFITVSGIFLAVFTFLSIEVRILQEVCSFNRIIGLSLILSGILLTFLGFLDLTARSWIEDYPKKKISGTTLAMLGISVSFILVGWFLF